MKKVFLFALITCMLGNIYAQDVIVKKDGTTILSKVLKLSDTDIEYKKWSNQNGPTYVIKTNQVMSINYQNGEKEVFGEDKKSKRNEESNTNFINGNVIDLSNRNNLNNTYNPRGNNNRVDIQDPYNNIYGNNNTVDALKQMQQSNYQVEIEKLRRKAKGWNVAGYVWFIGIGIGGGIGMSCISEVAGYATMGGGMAIGILCMFKSGMLKRSANSLERQMRMNDINISSIYNYEKTFDNGKNLKTGLSIMRDIEFGNYAWGMTLSYNF